MKIAFLTSIFLLSSSFLFAQCDNSYYPMNEGTTWEITNYDKKDKPQGKSINTILSSSESGNGYEAVVGTKLLDDKDKPVTDGEYTITCENGVIKIDLQEFLPSSIMDAYENMDVTFEGDNLEFPGDLSTGQTLPEASGKMTVQMTEGAMAMSTEMDFTYANRKVEAKESIETPIGNIESFKISQTIITTISMMGMNRTSEYMSVSWMAPKYGMVKTESYNQKGKLIGYSLLTSFEEK